MLRCTTEAVYVYPGKRITLVIYGNELLIDILLHFVNL
jgi:hypothetical protein